jgi:hypothetical protein
VFDPAESVTLWQLPDAVEEDFESHWERWLDQAAEWTPFFQRLESPQEKDLKVALQSLDLITGDLTELFSRLRLTAEGRAVPLPGSFTCTNQDLAMLALGFARGEPGALAIPYAKRGIAC